MLCVRLTSYLASGLALAALLAGCFPRLARYDADGPQQASRPQPSAQPVPDGSIFAGGPIAPFKPTWEPLAPERVRAFIMLTNPYLSADLVEIESRAILRYAADHAVPTSLLLSLLATESSFNPRAVSPVGAQGLGQLMPATARDMGVNDPFDPEQNISGTAKYLAWLGRSFERHPQRWELALASYLAGIGTVSKQLKGGKPLTNEQTVYVKKIIGLTAKV